MCSAGTGSSPLSNLAVLCQRVCAMCGFLPCELSHRGCPSVLRAPARAVGAPGWPAGTAAITILGALLRLFCLLMRPGGSAGRRARRTAAANRTRHARAPHRACRRDPGLGIGPGRRVLARRTRYLWLEDRTRIATMPALIAWPSFLP